MKDIHLKKSLKLVTGFLLLAVFAQIIWVFDAQAAAPRFNIYTPYVHEKTEGRDYYLLDVKNETKNSSWGFPVSADAGDILVFYLYYHNGGVDSVAQNTTLRVSLPSGQSTYHTVTAYLWADNAENATYYSPFAQSVGINLSSSQKLEYLADSVKWYPDRRDWHFDSSVPFPSGQSGNSLFGSGINIGSVQDCWEYSGAIMFKVKVGSTQTGNLSLNKTVRNLTTSQTYYSESTNAKAGDRLMFQIQVQNTYGWGGTLSNIFVRDVLPSYLSYVSGSARLDSGSLSDSFVSDGVNIGSLSAGNVRTIKFEAMVNSGVSGGQTLTNYAYARADQVGEKSDSATIYISSGYVSSSNLVKKVANLTTPNGTETNNQAWVDNLLQYTISYTNTTGVVLSNVQITDVLPSYTVFQDVANSGYYDSSRNQITWNVGTIGVNSSISVSYRVKVANVPYDGFVIGNTALLKAQEINDIISNEVRTTVLLPVVKGAKVEAITGANSLIGKIVYSLIVSFVFVAAVYLILKHADYLRLLKLKLISFKIRARETL